MLVSPVIKVKHDGMQTWWLEIVFKLPQRLCNNLLLLHIQKFVCLISKEAKPKEPVFLHVLLAYWHILIGILLMINNTTS